ncbi:PD-(D/E)XK nuclease family protein [Streptomyces olivaceus]|uniref:PD-(D/E)XK nuclease family protein n=1 Tax=Streptomyces olivaceus TaxID=47716 RepID=UPI001CD01AAF|nr:PD-(D/E)XK nuclease family protein [Streptomyces olivaceus]MBZ6130708.1 PD-(D/E)XK nuclease family protein [Streptomyces olivaceus]
MRPNLVGRAHILKISATDVQERSSTCGMGGALKVRPDVVSSEWRRRRDESHPFLGGVIREAACALHDDPRVETWEGTHAAIQERMAAVSLHPATRSYAERAIANYLEAHEVLSAETPGLQFRCFDPKVFPEPSGTLTVWAPLYESPNGVREIRKIRLGGVRAKPEKPDRWTVVAAHVAGLFPPQGISLIRVVEVGLKDASYQVLFEATPEVVRSTFTEVALPYLQKIISADSVHPGTFCKDCKIAGCCDALDRWDGFLGQTTQGAATRSVSARDIELYEICPAQWFLTYSQFLPRKTTPGAASHRGRLIHEWIARAHSRRRKCTAEDVGAFREKETLTGPISEDEYAEIQPYLAQHVEVCPLSTGSQVISIEAPLYGYDASADVIIASTPDIILVDDDGSLVIRETKTTSREIPQDSAEAFDKFFASAWLLNLFASGYRGPYQSASARLELEVISTEESNVFTWDLSDAGVLRMARKEVRLRSKSWHRDTTWEANPGKHCTWCPVRSWCPEAETEDAVDADALD